MSRAERDGLQKGAAVEKSVKRRPSRASVSRRGVAMSVAPVATEIAVTQIVGDDEDDIGRG